MCETVRCKQYGEEETVKPGECILQLLKLKPHLLNSMVESNQDLVYLEYHQYLMNTEDLPSSLCCSGKSSLALCEVLQYFLFFTLYLSEVGLIIPISQKKKLRYSMGDSWHMVGSRNVC